MTASGQPWWEGDPARLEREARMLHAPWQLAPRSDGRYAWTGGTLEVTSQGVVASSRALELIYPRGFPARFIEARLEPRLPREHWGMLGAHVNVDGSACYIAGEGWTPQLTARDAFQMMKDWWFNYWVIVDQGRWWLTWPERGRVHLDRQNRAALSPQ